MQTDILEKPEIQQWLEECKKPSTRRSYTSSIKRFFTWYRGSYDEFIGLEPKQLHHVLKTFIAESNGVPPNTVGGIVNRVNAFLLYLDKPVAFRRGEKPKPQPDIDSHNFSNGELSRMFDVGNTKEKALLSLMASLGWEISAALELDKEQVKALLERARSEGQQFIYWRSVRQKTGVPRLGVLNPLAIEWLGKWLAESKGRTPRKRKPDKKTADRPVSTLFDLTPEAVNKLLRRLARHAGIAVTGRLHSHRIRAWVMSGLTSAGWNEWQVKFFVGKAIPVSDSTYLQSLEQDIRDRYPKTYEKYLNIKPAKIIQIVDEELKQRVAQLEKENTDLQRRARAHGSIAELKELLDRVGKLEKEQKRAQEGGEQDE